jgi:two-component system, OmpR family, response regulator
MDRSRLKTILYVDDEADIRRIVRMALGIHKDLTIHACDSGERALPLMLELKPDLLLLDVMMAGMDGPTLLRQMKREPALAEIPVIFMTAKAMPDEVARFRELGAIGVIGKPFDPLTLGEQIFALWQNNSFAPAAANVVVRDRLSELSSQFLQRTQRELAGLRELLANSGPSDVATLKRVERVAHGIRGTGAALGFDTVSAYARDVERCAEESSRERELPDPQVAARLADYTARLDGVVSRLMRQINPS